MTQKTIYNMSKMYFVNQRFCYWRKKDMYDIEKELDSDFDKAIAMYQEFPCLRKNVESYIPLIKRKVVGQDKAIKDLLYVAYYNQYMNFLEEYMSEYQGKMKSMFLIASTGTGKTTMLKALEEAFDVPVYRANVTAMTSAGYVGDKLENMLLGLLERAKGELDIAERGILLIDEIDKKVISTTNERDVAGKSVQQELLKLFEDATVNVPLPERYKGIEQAIGKNIPFHTGKLTIILAGACVGLDEIRDKRTRKTRIGFASKTEEKSVKSEEYTAQDLIDYGFIPELVGRISIIEEFKKLTKDDLIDIIYFSEESAMQEGCRVLASLGVDSISIDPLLWERIVDEVDIEKLGVRDLNSKIEKLFMPIIFEAFQHTRGGRLYVTADGNFELTYLDENKKYTGKCISFEKEEEE